MIAHGGRNVLSWVLQDYEIKMKYAPVVTRIFPQLVFQVRGDDAAGEQAQFPE